MTLPDHIASLAADFIARVTAYLLGLRGCYAPDISPCPEGGHSAMSQRLVRGVVWDGHRGGVQHILSTPNYGPHLRLGGIPALRLADAKRCPRRCLAQRWRVIFCVFLTYARTARGDVVLPRARALSRIMVGRGPPAAVLIYIYVSSCPSLDLG